MLFYFCFISISNIKDILCYILAAICVIVFFFPSFPEIPNFAFTLIIILVMTKVNFQSIIRLNLVFYVICILEVIMNKLYNKLFYFNKVYFYKISLIIHIFYLLLPSKIKLYTTFGTLRIFWSFIIDFYHVHLLQTYSSQFQGVIIAINSYQS